MIEIKLENKTWDSGVTKEILKISHDFLWACIEASQEGRTSSGLNEGGPVWEEGL
jgi:hypothetical protein